MLHDIKDLTLEGKKDPTSMQQRLKNLETKFESENEDKVFSFVRKIIQNREKNRQRR